MGNQLRGQVPRAHSWCGITPNRKHDMSTDFDKFEWHRAVTRDGRIQASHRLVLGDLFHSVKHGSDLKFRVRQDTIAARLNVSLRSVNGAFRAARELNYLGMTQRRSTGNGNHGADEYQLILPESHADYAHDSGSDTHEMQESHAQIDEVTRTNCKSDTQTPTPLPAETETLKVLQESSSRRFSKRGVVGTTASEPLEVGAVPKFDDAPSRFCANPQHDENYQGGCHACGVARRALEAWEAGRIADVAADRERRWRIGQACRVCEGTNWIPDTEPVKRCHHDDGQATA